MSSITVLQTQLAAFATARDWDQFHTPKNLAMALSGEAGELLEHFQWLTPEQSERDALPAATLQAIEEEMADVFLYLLQLSNRLGVDLEAVAAQKLQRNAEKYPVEQAKGNAVKYSRRAPSDTSAP